ncbi:flagellin [Rhizobium sp. ZK1]|uniref:flagellin N-terminal helical domain-containing protein n=1 Tax=Rhizobium sp. ZK1 TaxID=3389872 RepID=UPI0039F716FE
MSSINTNYSSIAALQTLRSATAGLHATQNKVSSGLRIEKASDNAAYWSVATAMRTDNRALSAVSDALGLGEALVDTSSTALASIIDIIGDMKAKLIAATEKSIDKAKIQDEISALGGRLLATAASTSFSGENWLNTDVPGLDTLTKYDKSIVSAFIRGADNSVSVGTTDVDLTQLVLFNSTGGGLLQADAKSLGMIGGLRNADFTGSGQAGYSAYRFSGPSTLPDPSLAAFTATDRLTFDLTVDGTETRMVTIDKNTIDSALGTSNGMINSADDFARVIGTAISNMGWSPGTVTSLAGNLVFFSGEIPGASESSMVVSNVTSTLSAGYAFWLDAVALNRQDGTVAAAQFAFSGPFFVHRDVKFSFSVQVNNSAAKAVTIDRNLVDSVLGTSDGKINTAGDYARMLNAALAGTGMQVSSAGASVILQADAAMYPEKGATRSSVRLFGVSDNIGFAPNFDITNIDITNPANDLQNYIGGINMMEQKVTKAAAYMGDIGKRLNMQDNFVNSLQDAVASGIGRLIDADMEEESSRLTALQSQQQLALQSLWIANSAPQNVLELFQ